MKTRYVIKNTPTKLPVSSTLLFIMALDYYHASQIVWGAFIAIYSLNWIASIILILKEEKIDLNEFSDQGQSNYLKFKRSLQELIKEREAKK